MTIKNPEFVNDWFGDLVGRLENSSHPAFSTLLQEENGDQVELKIETINFNFQPENGRHEADPIYSNPFSFLPSDSHPLNSFHSSCGYHFNSVEKGSNLSVHVPPPASPNPPFMPWSPPLNCAVGSYSGSGCINSETKDAAVPPTACAVSCPSENSALSFPGGPKMSDQGPAFKLEILLDSFELNSKNGKSTLWTCSKQLRKIFLGINVLCPITISLQKAPPAHAFLRITPVYSRLMDISSPLQRCPHHVQLYADTYPEVPVGHVIRLNHGGAVYQTDGVSGYHSAALPLRSCCLVDACKYVVNLQCLCFSSCAGGMNRRPFDLVFSLEESGTVLASDSIGVRVCACPLRDRKMEEASFKVAKKLKREDGDHQTVCVPQQLGVVGGGGCESGPGGDGCEASKKEDSSLFCAVSQMNCNQKQKQGSSLENEIFTLQIYGKTNFAIVSKVVEGLNAISSTCSTSSMSFQSLNHDSSQSQSQNHDSSQSQNHDSSQNQNQSQNQSQNHDSSQSQNQSQNHDSSQSQNHDSSKSQSHSQTQSQSELQFHVNEREKVELQNEKKELEIQNEPKNLESAEMCSLFFDMYSWLSRKVVKNMTAETWLTHLNLRQYVENFQKKGYDDIVCFSSLDGNDLDELEIFSPGHRKKLISASKAIFKFLKQSQILNLPEKSTESSPAFLQSVNLVEVPKPSAGLSVVRCTMKRTLSCVK